MENDRYLNGESGVALNVTIKENPPSPIMLPAMEREHWRVEMESVLVRLSKLRRFGASQAGIQDCLEQVKGLYACVDSLLCEVDRAWAGTVVMDRVWGRTLVMDGKEPG